MLGRNTAVLTGNNKKPAIDFGLASTGALDPRFTFTRPSVAAYYDVTGTLQQAANNTARFDFDPTTHVARGLLMEEPRTNSIRNPRGLNAVVSGAGPTYWTLISQGSVNVTVAANVTESGMPAVDFALAGTATATTLCQIYLESPTFAGAVSGQNWTASVFGRLISGSLAGFTSTVLQINENNSGGSGLVSSNTAFTPTGSGLSGQRFNMTRLTNNASCAYVNPILTFFFNSGAVISATVRVSLPQLELGAWMTSPIF